MNIIFSTLARKPLVSRTTVRRGRALAQAAVRNLGERWRGALAASRNTARAIAAARAVSLGLDTDERQGHGGNDSS
jgi:hypothetical protein